MELSELFKAGPLVWIQILIALGILIVFLIKVVDLYLRKKPDPGRLSSGIHSILFLGSFAAVFGLLIQIIGIVEAINAIIEAADISPAIVMEGVKRSFYNPIFGMITFLVSGVFWFILQARYKNISSGN
jgi:hypothetical protein